MEGFVAAVMVALAFVAGASLAGNFNDKSWQNDCNELGVHRVADVGTYKCEKVK